MERLVWVDGWQMQCCGDPFTVGQAVSWSVSTEVDVDYMTTVVGSDTARAIQLAEDHHDLIEHPEVVDGIVRDIDAVSCRFARQGAALYPVPDTAVVQPLSRADGWETENAADDDVTFLGYLVRLD